MQIIARRVKDEGVRWLANVILSHYHTAPWKGMPLGNWTSQFFANIYLNELDQFIKHKLRAKNYIRYVDDFVILHHSKTTLQEYETKIRRFLQMLKLELHPDKCQIIALCRGITFLGFRTFYHYKLVRERNIRKIWKRIREMLDAYEAQKVGVSEILNTLQGWQAYAKQGNTYHLRERIINIAIKELEVRTK